MIERIDEPDAQNTPPPEDKSADAGKGLTRREFVIRLGAGAGAGIVVFFPLRGELFTPSGTLKGPPGQPDRPRLRDDIVFGMDGEMTTICRHEEANPILCAVNRPGREVLRRLDGRHTIEEISKAVATHMNISATEALDAKVALFVAHLSMLGFLQKAFCPYIIEKVVA